MSMTLSSINAELSANGADELTIELIYSLVDWKSPCGYREVNGIDSMITIVDIVHHRTIPLERFRFVNWKGDDIIDAFEAHVVGKAPNAAGEVVASWDWISKFQSMYSCIDC